MLCYILKNSQKLNYLAKIGVNIANLLKIRISLLTLKIQKRSTNILKYVTSHTCPQSSGSCRTPRD